MNNYCVYKHTSPSEKVYVGITETNPTFGKFGKNHPAGKMVKQCTKEGIFVRY